MEKEKIKTVDLTKIYKLKGQQREIIALNKVNLSVKEGEIFGLLGPNGAGKTTIIQILTTLKQPTSGSAYIGGYDVVKNSKQAKSKISLMLESDMLYYRTTGYKNLKFFCKIYNVYNYKEKIYNIAKEFELEKWLNQYVENYSSGMKMRLALCRTLLLERDILFLDEPTLGLDVKSIAFIIEGLKNLKKTIFLTSHDMSVVEKLCNRIAFINHGTILKIGTKEDIGKLLQSEIVIELEIIENKKELIKELNQQEFIVKIDESNKGLIVSLKERKFYKNFFSIIIKYDILKISEIELSLEDLFLKII